MIQETSAAEKQPGLVSYGSQQLAMQANSHCHIHGKFPVWLVIQELEVVGCKRVDVSFVLLGIPDLQSLHDRQTRLLDCSWLPKAELLPNTVYPAECS